MPSGNSIELPASVSLFQERHADLRTIHPGHLTSPVRQSGRGKHEEELFQRQPLIRGVNDELRPPHPIRL